MEEKIFVKNKNSLKLATLVDRPEGDGQFPIVIILGGFIEYKEHLRLGLLARVLAKNGIGAIRFDPSGYGESEGTLEHDYRFTNFVKDAQSVFNYAINLSWVDKDKIGIFGESMGGIQALILASNNSFLVKALAVVSSPTVMGGDDDLKGRYKAWKRDGYREGVSTKYGKLIIPFDFIQDARQWNALDYLKDIRTPIFVVWCSDDVNVSPKITKQLFDNAIGPKEFKVLEGADHYLNKDAKMIEILVNNVVEFLARKLK